MCMDTLAHYEQAVRERVGRPCLRVVTEQDMTHTDEFSEHITYSLARQLLPGNIHVQPGHEADWLRLVPGYRPGMDKVGCCGFKPVLMGFKAIAW